MLKVVLKALSTHITGNIIYCCCHATLVWTINKALENLAHILAVVLEWNVALRIVQLTSHRLQILARWKWVWAIHI